MLWSPVTSTPKPAASALASRMPFFNPAHDCCCTVRTLCPTRRRASCLGNCSSRRISKRAHRFVSGLQGGQHLLPRHGWESVEKFINAVVPLKIVNQVTEGHSSSRKYGNSAQDFGIAVDEIGCCRHLRLFVDSIASTRNSSFMTESLATYHSGWPVANLMR